jgi:dGTPase
MGDGAARLNWGKLLSDERFPATSKSHRETDPDWIVATPTRRMGDKTQVFPLKRNESVRNRLTHSHEVSNIARSIGTHLINNSPLAERIIGEATESNSNWKAADVRRSIPAILAAVGLAHDLGNPPFGHQGESAIRMWIRGNERELFGASDDQHKFCRDGSAAIRRDLERLTPAHREDFRQFEGNAQTIRTVTRLQVVKDNRGLNLT